MHNFSGWDVNQTTLTDWTPLHGNFKQIHRPLRPTNTAASSGNETEDCWNHTEIQSHDLSHGAYGNAVPIEQLLWETYRLEDPLLTDEPSPVKAMKAEFASLLDNATLPVPSIPTKPWVWLPLRRLLRNIFKGHLLHGLSSTTSVSFRLYSTPSTAPIRLNMPPHTSHYSPDDPLLLPCLSAENAASCEHIKSSTIVLLPIILNNLAVRNFQTPAVWKGATSEGHKEAKVVWWWGADCPAPSFRSW